MSHIYFVLGVIGWVLTPIVLLAYAIWPSSRRGFDVVVPTDGRTEGSARKV